MYSFLILSLLGEWKRAVRGIRANRQLAWSTMDAALRLMFGNKCRWVIETVQVSAFCYDFVLL
jgi:hypothetical protein